MSGALRVPARCWARGGAAPRSRIQTARLSLITNHPVVGSRCVSSVTGAAWLSRGVTSPAATVCHGEPRGTVSAGLAGTSVRWSENSRLSAKTISLTPRSAFTSMVSRLQRTKEDSSKRQPQATIPSTPAKPSDNGEASSVVSKALPSMVKHEEIYNLPNMLTFSRFIIAPAIGYAIVHDAHTWALGMFAYAGISDLLDGWIARKWKLQTVVGSVVDPMADKLLMTILTVSLAVQGSLPVWLAVVILGRDVGLAISAIYYRYISLPPPKTFMRYWDFSLPSAEVRPTTISKYNTFLQLGLMGCTMMTPFVTADVTLAMTALQYTVATTTIWSGLSYVFSKDAVRILSDNNGSKKDKK